MISIWLMTVRSSACTQGNHSHFHIINPRLWHRAGERSGDIESQNHTQPEVKWTQKLFDLVPTWTREPEMGDLQYLSRRLLSSLPHIDVSFFADGAFNKLYSVSSSNTSREYILRVSLPVEPRYKTESEVATLTYVRCHTDIPVPRVIAYDSSTNNEIRFEYILMEKVIGNSLKDAWPSLPWESKVFITREIAQFVSQLRNQKFEMIGNVYIRDD
jgi:hypothetical protein